MQDILDKIYLEAKHNETFLNILLDAKKGTNAMVDFCNAATEYGYAISPADFFDFGESYSCNQLKSTNGGGVNPYVYFDDPFEMFYVQLESLIVDKSIDV